MIQTTIINTTDRLETDRKSDDTIALNNKVISFIMNNTDIMSNIIPMLQELSPESLKRIRNLIESLDM